MKDLNEIIKKETKCIDGRDLNRLCRFMTVEQIESTGKTFVSEEAKNGHSPLPWTEEEVRKQLEHDLDFAFEKALNKRGISAGMMVEVVSMWVDILEADVGADPSLNYAQYGLPYLKAVAVHFGMDNPIGDDRGDEYQYSAEYDEGMW